jgi:ribosome-associated protein
MPRDSEAKTSDRALSGGNRIPGSELVELASRASGPGGQHVNTSSTRVSLRWNLRETRGLKPEARERVLARLKPRLTREGVLIVHSDRHRSRQRNREAALDRLQELVEGALYEAPERRPTGPSRAARNRRMDAKRQRGQLKNRRRLRGDDGD